MTSPLSPRVVIILPVHRVSIKSLYSFKNLLQRQMKGQITGNYYKMRRIYSSSFLASFNTPVHGYRQLHEALDRGSLMSLPPLVSVCYSEHGKKSSTVLRQKKLKYIRHVLQ